MPGSSEIFIVAVWPGFMVLLRPNVWPHGDLALTIAPHPTLSGITYAHAWQYAQSGLPQAGCADFTSTGNCNLVNAGRGFPVDLDTAISSNPSSG